MKEQSSFIKALLMLSLMASPELRAENILNKVLNEALSNNAELKASESKYHASDALVATGYTPDDPIVGLSKLKRGMETTYLTLTQKFRFPSKYYVQGKAAKELSLAQKASHDFNVLSIRSEVITSYYNLYRIQQSIAFTINNLQSVKEVARVAENKYAAKLGMRADSMRSHLEITRLEIDLLNYRQEEVSAIEKLHELINSNSITREELSNVKVARPTVNNGKVVLLEKALKAGEFSNSNQIKMKKHELEAAKWNHSLARWDFAPDIQLQYQHAIDGAPEDSRIYGVGITVPLFFWSKGYKSKAASKMKISKSYELVSTQNKTKTKLVNLLGLIQTTEKTLEIYDTSLIPQAESTYNTSLSSYRANKLRLIDLLDSERSLYQVRLGYLKTLHLFAKNLTELEKVSGIIVSDF